MDRNVRHGRWVGFVVGVTLLVPLLAACGGESASVPASNGSAPAATSAPVARSDADASAATSAESAAPAAVGAPVAIATSAAAAVEPVSEVKDGATSDSAAAPARAPVQPPAQQQPATPLKAGDVDDNADFDAYQQYLRDFYSSPGRVIDISERYILTVTNDQQQPVLDARVRVLDGTRQLFDGRTYAGGKTIFFPRAVGVAAQTNMLRVLIDKGNSTVEGTLVRGQDTRPSFVLQGVEALPQHPRLDVMFLLDATGSMGDEIAQIQNTIVNIASRIDQFNPRPAVRFGLVAYRDRGDAYVTRVYDFTPDVEAFRRLLQSVSAGGGGDEPESLNEGLHAAIQGVNWADDAVRLTFLVADAPPHLDYANDYDYAQELRVAAAKGIKIYPIAASNSSDDAEYVFRQLAQQTLAHFIFLTYQPGQNSGTPGESTVHNVDPNAFSVERLDDLVVQVVQHELAQAVGAS